MDTLTRFNQQIIQHQDDAYTLAFYLSGSEARAEQITQAAVTAAYQQVCGKGNGLTKAFGFVKSSRLNQSADLRLVLFQQVVRCQRTAPGTLAQAGLLQDFQRLCDLERQALVLIDLLGLTYSETATVLGRTVQEVAQSLGLARKNFGACHAVSASTASVAG